MIQKESPVMPNVAVHENHLTFGGVAYFRGGAEDVEAGCIGEKRTPLTKQNYLEVKDRIPVPKIAVAKTTVVEIDFNKTSKGAFGAAVSALIKGVPVKFSGDVTFDKLRSGQLKLVKFSVPYNVIKKAANNSPQKLRSLIEWGNDARIVNEVFVVMEASMADQFNSNANAELSVGVDGLEATVGGSHTASGTTTVNISKGTTFAYLLLKIEWDAKLKRNRTKIVDLNDDQWSFN